ncbi:metal-sensitive transcriptional regulator [Bifidobacterium xylocopae]|uniref:Transcriptional regulator n=1 Tax=Bifidobacterium xylocopae TaxID=2493119 RepID=A0A366KEF0_9BIFI|nr:metal-sensitive transcriptional regulator [Bifidobacterium xylocopae]RBP99612.1 transcriptional regulator [Bifidobacterium xylocopae]
MAGYVSDKKRVVTRLRRIEGQVRAIEKMVESDAYCIDVLTQVAASTSALKSVALNILDDHMNHCVREAAAKGGEEADKKMREASDAIGRLVRS